MVPNLYVSLTQCCEARRQQPEIVQRNWIRDLSDVLIVSAITPAATLPRLHGKLPPRVLETASAIATLLVLPIAVVSVNPTLIEICLALNTGRRDVDVDFQATESAKGPQQRTSGAPTPIPPFCRDPSTLPFLYMHRPWNRIRSPRNLYMRIPRKRLLVLIGPVYSLLILRQIST